MAESVESNVELLLEDDTGSFEFIGFEGSLAETKEGRPPASHVAASLGDLIGVAQELVPLPAGVVSRQQAVEPQRGVDNFPVIPLGPGGRVGQAGEDQRVFPVLRGAFDDRLVENLEVLVGEAVEQRRMADLVQRTLHRAPSLHHLPRDLEDGVTVPFVAGPAAEQRAEACHQALSSSMACASVSRVRLPPLRTTPTFLFLSSPCSCRAAASAAAPAPSASIRVRSNIVKIA